MNTKTPLTIKNGVFFRGNEIVPAKCGDPEQIDLLNKLRGAIGDGSRVNTTVILKEVDVLYEFTCNCGNKISESYSDYPDQDIDFYDGLDIIEDVDFTCSKCGLIYDVNACGIIKLRTDE